MVILPVETILETEAALLEADRACEVAESRLAEFKGLLKQMRAERDYWREQAQEMRADRDYWKEQTRRLLPRRKRTIATDQPLSSRFAGADGRNAPRTTTTACDRDGVAALGPSHVLPV